MSNTTTTDTMPDETAEIKAALESMLAEVKLNHEIMRRDKQEIERLKLRTRARMEHIEKMLER